MPSSDPRPPHAPPEPTGATAASPAEGLHALVRALARQAAAEAFHAAARDPDQENRNAAPPGPQAPDHAPDHARNHAAGRPAIRPARPA